jgi:hypothetical protein
MSLPWLNEKSKTVSMLMSRRKGEDGFDGVSPEVGGNLDPGLKAAAEDLHAAIKTDSIHGIAMALKAAFECLDAMPHVEGEHFEEKE